MCSCEYIMNYYVRTEQLQWLMLTLVSRYFYLQIHHFPVLELYTRCILQLSYSGMISSRAVLSQRPEAAKTVKYNCNDCLGVYCTCLANTTDIVQAVTNPQTILHISETQHIFITNPINKLLNANANLKKPHKNPES